MYASSRPRVFLSSTIYDFADLRSAIKYWLEESGYEVSASEFNDFPKDIDRNSYDACLESIDTCQYFILLIGARAGGRVALPEKTTITMAEYRRAYERAKEGKLKIAALVRRSVWTVREDRRALAGLIRSEYQQEHGLSNEDVTTLQHHASRIVVDAEIVFGFISEVTRAAEMKEATQNPAAPLPINNWIHPFENFRDIVEVLRTVFVRTKGLRRAALLANLRQELVENLTGLLERKDGTLIPIHAGASMAREQFSGGPDDMSTVREIDLRRLAFFGYMSSDRLLAQALDTAIESGEFLQFDTVQHRYTSGEIQGALLNLRKAISAVRTLCARALTPEKRTELLSFKEYQSNTAKTSIPNWRISPLIILYDKTKDTIQLSLAILRYIEIGEYSPPELSPISPFKDQEELLRAERPIMDDVIRFALGIAGHK